MADGTRDIYEAAEQGDETAVRRFLSQDPGLARAKGGPRGWDALTYLCFSKALREARGNTERFAAAARALLDAGADANTGWFETGHHPTPVWESAIYGAAGFAQDEALTRLLLERGADPNDDETAYHAAETYDNGAVRALVESGKLNADGVATLLLRKTDWHDEDGLAYLLANGADPNRATRWRRRTALHHAIKRDNRLAMIRRLLDAGARADALCDEGSAVAMAARRGRADILAEFAARKIPLDLEGADGLLAACALGDSDRVRNLAASDPAAVTALVTHGGQPLAEFAGNDNTAGLALLLELGVPIAATFDDSDGYWGLAGNTTALHVAAWRASHDAVALLIARGAPVNAEDAWGRTPLVLAVKACVDSYWTNRRSPASVAALLRAGASTAGVPVPSGYAPVDELLRGTPRV